MLDRSHHRCHRNHTEAQRNPSSDFFSVSLWLSVVLWCEGVFHVIPYEFDAERFSRWMAYVLRHNPARYGLQTDRHGYVNFEEFFVIAKKRYPDVTPERLRGLIEASSSARFEIAGNRLRARYGHSIPVEPPGTPVEPPARLYHGTEASRTDTILADGLSPVDRRMVHLSETIEEALTVARRRTDRPVVFRIHAQDAHRAGIAFHREGKIYLAAAIPATFLSLEPLPASFEAPSAGS